MILGLISPLYFLHSCFFNVDTNFSILLSINILNLYIIPFIIVIISFLEFNTEWTNEWGFSIIYTVQKLTFIYSAIFLAILIWKMYTQLYTAAAYIVLRHNLNTITATILKTLRSIPTLSSPWKVLVPKRTKVSFNPLIVLLYMKMSANLCTH